MLKNETSKPEMDMIDLSISGGKALILTNRFRPIALRSQAL